MAKFFFNGQLLQVFFAFTSRKYMEVVLNLLSNKVENNYITDYYRRGSFFPSFMKGYFREWDLSNIIWVFPEMVVPPGHPKMIIFSKKTNGCWVPPFQETSIYIYMYM